MGKTHLFISNSEIKDARRLGVRGLLFAPVLLLVIAVNTYYDPAGLYRNTVHRSEKLEFHTALSLLKGHKVKLNGEDIDDRLLQKYMVDNLTSAPDIVILGSSHSMWIGTNIFPGQKVMNNSILRAVLPDYLGIFEGYAQHHLYPKRVICVLDPQLISSPLISERWLSIKEDTFSMLDRIGTRSEIFQQPLIPQAWLNIISLSYFQESIRGLYSRHAPQIDNDDKSNWQLLFKDGRRLFHFQARSLQESSKEIARRQIAGELTEGKNEKLLKHLQPQEELKRILEDFIRYLQAHHIRVTLYMFPVHQQVYQSFLDQPKAQGTLNIVDVEHYYQGLAEKLNVEIVGSYDPAACGLEGKDFDDGDHIRIDVLEKILKQKGTQCSMPGL